MRVEYDDDLAPRAVAPLIRVMETDVKAAPVIRALASLGDPQAVRPLLGQLHSPEKAVRAEVLRALASLTDEVHAEVAQRALLGELPGLSGELRDLADRSLRTLTGKFGNRAPGADAAATDVEIDSRMAQSLLQSPETIVQAASLIAEPGRHDPSSPPPGRCVGVKH